MTIGRIGGPMLKENLIRQGVDLSFETDLLYLDVNNMRVGVNTLTPNVTMDINGTARFNSNLQINGSNIATYANNTNITITPHGTGKLAISYLTSNRVPYVGTGNTLVDSTSFTFDGTKLTLAANLVVGNLDIFQNTISNTNLNGNIILDTTGTGNIIIDTTATVANRIFYSGNNKEIITSSNLTFNGNDLVLSGVANVTTLNASNVRITSNEIGTTNLNGNITLIPNGTGNILVNTATPNTVFYAGPQREMLTSTVLQFNGTTFRAANISITNNTISAANSNGDIIIDPVGTGKISLAANNAVTLPGGDTSQRPNLASAGDLRFNSETTSLEYFNGIEWKILLDDIVYNLLDTFEGDGSTTVFILTQATNSFGAFITLNGVVQSPGTSYGISETTLTFTEAPTIGDRIEVRYLTLAFDIALKKIQDVNTYISVDDQLELARFYINGILQLQISATGTKINGHFSTTPPTNNIADIVISDTDNFVINNKTGSACLITLPSPGSYVGRQLTIKNLQTQNVISNASNVCPIDSMTPGTAILTNVVGKWATLVSDGSNWIIMAAN